jgi:hypothetical protein
MSDQITAREYWRDCWRWAGRNTKLLTAEKIIGGPLLAAFGLYFQWKFAIHTSMVTLQILGSIVFAYALIAGVTFLGNWLFFAPPVRWNSLQSAHAEQIKASDAKLFAKDARIAELEGSTIQDSRSYSKHHLATLKQKREEGERLYQANFSPNDVDGQTKLDVWFKRYSDWQGDVRAVLIEQDIPIFNTEGTVGSQTKATAGAFGQLHLVSRSKLLEQLERIDSILRRYPPR